MLFVGHILVSCKIWLNLQYCYGSYLRLRNFVCLEYKLVFIIISFGLFVKLKPPKASSILTSKFLFILNVQKCPEPVLEYVVTLKVLAKRMRWTYLAIQFCGWVGMASGSHPDASWVQFSGWLSPPPRHKHCLWYCPDEGFKSCLVC